MPIASYANRGSIAKNILVCIAFLFYLSGCAESGAGSDNSGTRNIAGNSSGSFFDGVVIGIEDEWLYRKGTSSPSPDWISAGFDDSAWLAGNTGIGYGDGDDATVLSDMQGNYVTVYTRKVLNYDGSVTINSLDLEIDYDDGFVAYINGQEVARANMPAGQPSFDTLASASNEAGTAVLINLDGFINLIGIGDNVLAIEIHNDSLASSDLSFLPRLLVNVGGAPPPPPTVSLSANPTNVVTNGSTTLNWSSTDATGCTASGDWSGSKATSGSQTINALASNSTFNLTCSGTGGSANDSVSVTVAAPSAPIVNLSASPSNLPYNGSTTLSWSSSNTSGCTASGDWTGNKATSGSQTMSALTSNSSFNLTCSGAGGNANDSVSVTVAAPSAPIVNLSASPSNLPYNGSTTLSWSSSNTSGCTASGDWSGNKATSGSQTMSALTSNSTFNLTCSGAGSNANDSVSVTVAAPMPTLSFSANPGTVSQNGSTTLNWNTTNATSCTASGDWSGSKAMSGSQTFNALTSSKSFNLSCSGAGGTVNNTVNVTYSSGNGAPTDYSYQGINQFFIAPGTQGSDSNDCRSTTTPCRTFGQVTSLMSSGDGLVLKDGFYTLAVNGTLDLYTESGNPIPRGGMVPAGISSQQPTVITVENLNTVQVEGSLRLGLTFAKVNHVLVYGISFHGGGGIYNGDYITIKNSGFEGGLGIGSIDHDQGNTYNLIEDVWVWGKNMRNAVIVYRSHHNTLRRVLIHSDGCDQAWCGEKSGNYSPGITVYNSHSNTLENIVVLDRSLGANPYGYADFSTAQHDSARPAQPEGELLGNNQWLGSMSINSEDSAMTFEADAVTTGTTATIRDFVVLKSAGGAGLDGAHRPYSGISIFDVSDMHLYPQGGSSNNLYIGCDVVNSGDPGCNHIINNVNSGAYTPGLASVTVPQKRYGTTDDLWPWPYEDRIKSEICVSNNVAITRGVCGTTQSISDYINSF